jgi:hypothetical protein
LSAGGGKALRRIKTTCESLSDSLHKRLPEEHFRDSGSLADRFRIQGRVDWRNEPIYEAMCPWHFGLLGGRCLIGDNSGFQTPRKDETTSQKQDY